MAGGTQGGGVKRWGGSAAPSLPPSSVFSLANQVLWIEYDAPSITTAAGKVSEARNKFDNVVAPLTEADPGLRMAISATGGPNSKPIASGSAYDGLYDNITERIAEGTAFSVYAVLRIDDWSPDLYTIALKVGPFGVWPFRDGVVTPPRLEGWHDLSDVGAYSTILGVEGDWVAVRAHVRDDGTYDFGVNNESLVSATYTGVSPLTHGVGISGLSAPVAYGSIDSHAALVVVLGEGDDAAMGRYFNSEFGRSLMWGSTPAATQSGTQGARVKRWAGAASVPSAKRYAIPFPTDGLPPLGIVDDGSGELIVDTDGDFIVEGANA